MSSIKGVNSGGAYDANESVKNVGNQSGVDSAQSVTPNQPQSSTEQPEELREKEKKGLEQYAAERIAEEQIKAQVKQTQLSGELDEKGTKTDPSEEAKKDRAHFDYHDPDNQPVPHLKPDGGWQRWDIADKKWK
jgi:hypothetical protein